MCSEVKLGTPVEQITHPFSTQAGFGSGGFVRQALERIGAGRGNRTLDTQLGKLLLYH
jgi:hypothetical protein